MDETYWFDATPLTVKPEKAADAPDSASNKFRKAWGGGAGLKGRLEAVRSANLQGMASDLWKDFWAGGDEISRFAAANGFTYELQRYDREWQEGKALPGMIFRGGERRQFLTWGEPVSVEFGNWSSVGQELVLAFGYIAVRHDLGLPHLIVDARVNDTTPPPGSWFYAKKSDFTSLSENYRGSDSASPMGRLRNSTERLDLGTELDRYFQAYCDRGEEAAVRAFLTPDRIQMLCAASMEFDLEITDEWLYLYATGINISSKDADRWAWVFSVTSRLLDHVALWRAAAGAEPLAERPPFYTERTVLRPADLAQLPAPSPGWQAFWQVGDPHM